MIKAVIFDLDGTIANTLPLCVVAFRKAVEPLAGRSLSDDDIIATFGPSEEGTIMKLIPDHYEEGIEAYLHYYKGLHSMCPLPFDGMREIIEGLRSAGLIVGMVTGKGKRSCKESLELYQMSHLFDMVETGSPDGQRKDHGIRSILDSFGLNPSEAIYVGDAPSDIEACHRIGVPIIAAAWAETARPGELLPLKPYKIFYSVPDFAAFLDEEVKTGK